MPSRRLIHSAQKNQGVPQRGVNLQTGSGRMGEVHHMDEMEKDTPISAGRFVLGCLDAAGDLGGRHWGVMVEWTGARMWRASCRAVESGIGPEDTAELLTLETDKEVIERQG